MRKIFLITSLAVLSLCASAQHYIGVSADLKSAFQFDQLQETQCATGGGGQLGFTYEFQRNFFVLNTGLAVGYTMSSQLLDSIHFSFPMYDTEGRSMNYVGAIDNRHDISQMLHFKLPLMMGIAGGHFYGLVGFIFDYTLPSWTTQTANLYTAGDYEDRYYDLLEDMPNHGYTEQRIKSTGKLKYRPDFRISAELGGSFFIGNASERRPKAKIGLFFEYGLTDANSVESISNKLYDFNTDEYLKVEMNHIYTTDAAYGLRINNFELGIRAHVLFDVGGVSTNNGCNCHKRYL